jgi:malate dehydrogenase
MKLGIIGGAGLLGSTTAFCVGQKGVADEIKLVDVKENVLMAHVMDMNQALLPVSGTKIRAAGYEDLHDCDLILVTASLPERKVESRAEYLNGNMRIVLPICKKLKEVCKKDAILLSATNPVDVFTYVYWKLLGWDRSRILGFSANDTLRLKWAAELVTGKEFDKIDAMCIGEHGDGQVRLYAQMKYDGSPMKVTKEERTQIEEATANWFRDWQELDSGRTTGWTSGVMLSEMIAAIALDKESTVPCSVVLEGEMGYRDVAMGMPVVLGREGVKEIKNIVLTDEQRIHLDAAAKKIQKQIKSIELE